MLANSTLELTKKVDNLLVLRTFSKAYAWPTCGLATALGARQ